MERHKKPQNSPSSAKMIGPKFKSVCQIVDFEIDWFDEKWRSIQFYPMTFLHDKELKRHFQEDL